MQRAPSSWASQCTATQGPQQHALLPVSLHWALAEGAGEHFAFLDAFSCSFTCTDIADFVVLALSGHPLVGSGRCSCASGSPGWARTALVLVMCSPQHIHLSAGSKQDAYLLCLFKLTDALISAALRGLQGLGSLWKNVKENVVCLEARG